MTTAAHGATNAHGAVIATRPASMPLHDIEMSGFPYLALVHAIADHEADARGEQRVDRDEADAQVGRAERRARVEAHPAEHEHQRADHDVAEVVAGDRVRRAVLVELPDAGPEDHRQRERRPAAGGVHDAGAGEVDRAVAEVQGLPRWASQPPPHTHMP